VGFAFMEIADSFKSKQDIDNASVAVQKALNEWEKRPFEHCNYDIMNNFLDTFDQFQKQGFPLDVSIGVWIWINLKGSDKATQTLKEIAQQESYAKLLGHMIITTFHNWWKSEGGPKNGEAMTLISKKLPEVEAVGQFVMMVMKGVQHQWPEIAAELTKMLRLKDPISDEHHAGLEFALAVIATQIQALPNLLPANQANRIREYIMKCISSPELASYPREAIQEYQDAWDKCLQRNESPIDGIASVLFDKLRCSSTVEMGNAKFKSPHLLMALSEKVVTFGGRWWKNIAKEYELVP
jgi:hypothetical protein